jgi:hypothetical protein
VYFEVDIAITSDGKFGGVISHDYGRKRGIRIEVCNCIKKIEVGCHGM